MLTTSSIKSVTKQNSSIKYINYDCPVIIMYMNTVYQNTWKLRYKRACDLISITYTNFNGNPLEFCSVVWAGIVFWGGLFKIIDSWWKNTHTQGNNHTMLL